jgi:hypothetical protein
MGARPLCFSTVCIRDDEAKAFEFRFTVRTSEVAHLVATAIGRGRKVRCYELGVDGEAPAREERYLASRGYRRQDVKL